MIPLALLNANVLWPWDVIHLSPDGPSLGAQFPAHIAAKHLGA